MLNGEVVKLYLSQLRNVKLQFAVIRHDLKVRRTIASRSNSIQIVIVLCGGEAIEGTYVPACTPR